MTHRQFTLLSSINVRHRNKIIILGVILIIMTIVGIQNEPYNNEKSYKKLITKTYSSSEILSLKEDIENNAENYNYKELNKKYKFQCIRKFVINTQERTGYKYTVLQDEKGGGLFLYFSLSGEIWYVAYYDHLPVESDFDFIEEGKTTTKELEEKKYNSYLVPTSGRHLYAYIVKEGVITIEVGRKNNTEVITNVQKYREENISKEELDMLYRIVPQILNVDKEEILKR